MPCDSEPTFHKQCKGASPVSVLQSELTQDYRAVLRKRAGSAGCLVLSAVAPATEENRWQPETHRPVCFLLVQIITFQQPGGTRISITAE